MTKEKGAPRQERQALKAKRLIIILAVLLVALALVSFFAKKPEQGLETGQQVLMDTAIQIRYLPATTKGGGELLEDVFAEMARLEKIFTRSVAESEVSKVNQGAGLHPVVVSEELFYVLEQAKYYSKISGGAFDPTIAPLVDLWGFHNQEYLLPEAEEIEKTLHLVDHHLLSLDRELLEASFAKKNMALELGGIAKGYIIDRALELMKTEGIKSAFINAGGDIGLIGARPDGSLWRIGIRDPLSEDKIVAVIPAAGGAVVTSGSYERVFEADGVTYHHLLDPKSGYPATELLSVTIVAPSALMADALSTAVFIMGPEKGMALIESLPGVEGVLVTAETKVLVSSGLKEQVELNLSE